MRQCGFQVSPRVTGIVTFCPQWAGIRAGDGLARSARQNAETNAGTKKNHDSSWFFSCSGSPTWTRTRDLRINSPSLYQLSYQGKEATFYIPETALSTV